jgi:hypothetical protein
MADGPTLGLLVRALSRPPAEGRHRARDGPSTGPPSGQPCLAPGGAASAPEPARSRRLLAPPAPHPGASQRHDRPGPSTRQHALAPVPGANALAGTWGRGVAAQRTRASAPTTPPASPAPRMCVGAAHTPGTPQQIAETSAPEANHPPREARRRRPSAPLGQRCCAPSPASRQ